jgi:hypothetical protein
MLKLPANASQQRYLIRGVSDLVRTRSLCSVTDNRMYPDGPAVPVKRTRLALAGW